MTAMGKAALCAVLAVLLSPITASPAAPKNACNANNCLRAVRASARPPGLVSASIDCLSFLSLTVSPCPATSSVTVYVTVAASSITSTVYATTRTPSVTTIVETETITSTNLNVVTSVISSEVDVTSTTTVTATTIAPMQRRDGVSQCTPSTIIPKSKPGYALACPGAAEYSSACSCIGASTALTTASQITTTITITSTVTTTPVAIVTNVDTTIVVQSDFTTTTASTIKQITSTTSSVSLFTLTVVATATTTTVTQSAPCSTYIAQASIITGSFVTKNGQFLERVTDEVLEVASSDPATAQRFVFVGAELRDPTTIDLAVRASPDGVDLVYMDFAQGSSPALHCNIPTVAGGLLTCTKGAALPAGFQLCPPYGDRLLSFGTLFIDSCEFISFNLVTYCGV